MNDRHLPDWDDNQLSLGKPACMSTPTLIEWIQRQLETPEETAQRLEDMKELHKLWHAKNPGIYACCINSGALLIKTGVMSVNEMREAQSRIKAQLEDYKSGSAGLVVLDEGMTVEPLYQRALEAFRGYASDASGPTTHPVDPEPEITYFSRRKDGQ